MSDLISRQAVIEALKTCYDTEIKEYTDGSEWIDYEQAVDLIKDIPSAQPEQQWILCSERLPKELKNVLITRKFLGGLVDLSFGNKYLMPCNFVEAGYLLGEVWHSCSDSYKFIKELYTDPIAWMPLPDPY